MSCEPTFRSRSYPWSRISSTRSSNGTGNVVAQVAYNGRIFAVDADGEADRSVVLHETRSG